MKNTLLNPLLYVTLLASFHLHAADRIHLSNGDRLSGSVLRKAGEVLLIKTEFAGELKVNWRQIEAISTDAPVFVRTLDGRAQTRRLQSAAAGEIAELYREPPSAWKFTGHANLGLSASRGNTDNEQVHFDGELIARSNHYRVTAGADIRRARDQKELSEDKARLFAKLDRFMNTQWYLYAHGEAARDEFKDWDLRATLNAGSGYQLLDSERSELSIEAGLGYVDEQRDAADENYISARWALRFSHELWNGALKMFHRHEASADLENGDNLEVRTRTGVRLPVRSGLTASTEFVWDWDKQPAPGREQSDKAWLVNLGYVW